MKKSLPLAMRPAADKGDHPIAVVAERTGLTQDVLRVWERRYQAVAPERGAGGQRRYTDADVERLKLLHAATRAGRSIGQIAHLGGDALAQLVAEDTAARESRVASTADSLDGAERVKKSLTLTRSLDAMQLDHYLQRSLAVLGVSAFLEQLVIPLLRQVGDEWHAGRLTPAQEHMASVVLYDITVDTMRRFSRAGAPRMLVATPAGERHAIGAALIGAFAAVEGWNVIYLGADLPAEEIATAAIVVEARVVALSVLYVDDRERLLGEVRALRSRLPAHVTLIVGGAGATPLARELSAAGARSGSRVTELSDELHRGEAAD